MDAQHGCSRFGPLDGCVKLIAPAPVDTHDGSKSVINLSKSFVLTAAQFSVLDRGLTFVPSKGTDSRDALHQVRSDLQAYHRRVRLAVHFENHPPSVPPPFMPKSDWVPPEDNIPFELALMIDSDLAFFRESFKIRAPRDNLDPEETEALVELRNNRDIVIKPADKGSAVVLLDREQYLWEGYRQLNDARYYAKLDRPVYVDTVPIVAQIVDSLLRRKFITYKQRDYLVGESEPRPRLFYMLPKIHKDPAAWSRPFEVPPGRPIVSDCSSETYHTAEYIDSYLYPLSLRHASYVKDTYDFVQKVKGLRVPAQSLLFTMDVDSLYTNIDIAGGMRAVQDVFQLHPDATRPDAELLRLLEINLTKNDFVFNGEFFLQIKGTAMGKKFAPSYANIFMAQWEASALASCRKRPLCYLRYLDDVWGVWPHSRSEFDDFLAVLNAHDPSITLKSCTSASSVDFLDTTTFKGPDFATTLTLDVKVFFKPTDTHALLHASSFHPKHTFAGLLKSQLLRFSRICSRQSDFMAAVKTLFTALAPRGYSRSARRAALKTYKVTRPPVVGPRLPLITMHSTSSAFLARRVREHFKWFQDVTALLPRHGIIAAYRKNRNLRDLLVRAKMPPRTERGSNRRSEFYLYRPWARNPHTGAVFATQRHSGPATSNCVYLIRCLTCGVQYVGETGNTLLTRFTQHRYNVRHGKETHLPLVEHFVLHGWAALSATVLQSNPGWSLARRRRAERIWIYRLGTLHPVGLNVGVGRGSRRVV